MKAVRVYRLGQVAYDVAWELQKQLAAEVAAGTHPPALLLLEHPHTYTFGRQGHAENLLWDAQTLAQRGVQVHWVDRGGDVTYHGPGQLVGYPLLPLGQVDSRNHLPQADYVGYLRRLEDVLIHTLLHFGIVSGRIPGKTGVWVQPDVWSRCRRCRPEDRQKPAKIAAIGVKVDARGVSRHGFALNVSPDMTYWDGIIGCGLKGYPVVALADLLSSPPALDTVMDVLEGVFGHVFNVALQPGQPEQAFAILGKTVG